MQFGSIIRKTLATLFRAWPILLLYLLWTALAAPLAYFMLSIPDATAGTITASALLTIACIGSFCALQAATIHWMKRAGEGERVKFNRADLTDLARTTFRGGAAVALITTILAFVGWGVIWTFPVTPKDPNAQTEINEPLTGEAPNATPVERDEPRPDQKGFFKDLASRTFWIEVVRVVLLWLALPLLAMRLWSEAVQNGIGAAVKSLGGAAWKAWSPGSLIIGFIALLFAVGGPVMLLSVGSRVESASLAVSLFGIRMAAAWLLPVLGWLFAMAYSTLAVRE